MFADLQRLTGITNHRLKLFKISHIIKKYREKVLLLLFPYIYLFCKKRFIYYLLTVFLKNCRL